MSGDVFYKTATWYKLRSKVTASWKAKGLPCPYCNSPIDWTVKRGHIVDHIKNRKQYPELALDPSNLQVVHYACNTRKAAFIENNNRVEIGVDGYPVGW
jgi:5-methylcytosine-specific restriction endonuclease McrA